VVERPAWSDHGPSVGIAGLPVVGGDLPGQGRQRQRAFPAVVPGGSGAVQHGGTDAELAAAIVNQFDNPALLRPVDMRGSGDLPEPAGTVAASNRADPMPVGVAVYPEGDAPVGQEQLAQLRPEDSPGRPRRAAGIDQRLQRMVAEQDDDRSAAATNSPISQAS
jgi:hypothetical protein